MVGLQPTGHLPQVGEAMRPRSEVGSLFVAASNADGGGANGLGRRRTSSDAAGIPDPVPDPPPAFLGPKPLRGPQGS